MSKRQLWKIRPLSLQTSIQSYFPKTLPFTLTATITGDPHCKLRIIYSESPHHSLKFHWKIQHMKTSFQVQACIWLWSANDWGVRSQMTNCHSLETCDTQRAKTDEHLIGVMSLKKMCYLFLLILLVETTVSVYFFLLPVTQFLFYLTIIKLINNKKVFPGLCNQISQHEKVFE